MLLTQHIRFSFGICGSWSNFRTLKVKQISKLTPTNILKLFSANNLIQNSDSALKRLEKMITLQKKGYLVTHRHSRLIDVNLTYFDFQYHENYDFKIQMLA